MALEGLQQRPRACFRPLNLPLSLPDAASAELPSTPIYRRPDLRQLEQELEKLFVFETEMTRTSNLTETVNFTLPTERGASREFSLTVELRRERSSLRTSVRLRMRPSQLVINFPDSWFLLALEESRSGKFQKRLDIC